MPAGPVIFDQPTPPQVSVSCRIGSGVFSTASAYSSILGAADNSNTNCSEYSTIVMGHNNIINPMTPTSPVLGCFNSIINGCNNLVTGCYNTILAGSENTICSIGFGNMANYNTISGYCNCIQSPALSNTISGYKSVVNNASYSVIGGGRMNCMDGLSGITNNSNIVGGMYNTVSGDYSNIVGGSYNTIFLGAHTNIVGGKNNKIGAIAFCTSIIGGENNTISNYGHFSIIGGGNNNLIDTNSIHNFLGSGTNNRIQPDACYNFLGAGDTNVIHAGSQYGVLGGGQFQNLCGCWNGILSGYNHKIDADSCYSVIGGGIDNCIATTANDNGTNGIFSGSENCICGSSIFSGIVSGGRNSVEEGYGSFIGGGDHNHITSPTGSRIDRSNVLGGGGNEVSDGWATIGGGQNNRIHNGANHSFLGGGVINTISGAYSSILGGANNLISSNSTFNSISAGTGNNLGNGATNTVDFSVIGGGAGNRMNVALAAPGGLRYAVIGGGLSNIIAQGADYSFIGGGGGSPAAALPGNVINIGSCNSVIVGGSVNSVGDFAPGSAPACHSFIGGGSANCIATSPSIGNDTIFSAIVSGSANCIGPGACYSHISGGKLNEINGKFSFIGNGGRSVATPGNRIDADNSFIGAGFGNIISQSSNCSVIVGGVGQNIGNAAPGFLPALAGFLGGGDNNCIDTDPVGSLRISNYDTITGGVNNRIMAGASFSSIVGGKSNRIGNSAAGYQITVFNVINGGCENTIDTTGPGTTNLPSCYGVIGGGEKNIVCAGSFHGTIGGGAFNSVIGSCATIAGGAFNIANSEYAVIPGGFANIVDPGSSSSTVGGGIGNRIDVVSGCSIIAAGEQNCICNYSAYSTISGGYKNVIGPGSPLASVMHSFVGGGNGNLITDSCSVIAGGSGNTVSSVYSSILGGFGNTIPVGYANSHIIGSGLVLGAGVGNPGSLHINNLWMGPVGTVCAFAGFPSPFVAGTVYVDTTPGLGNPLRMA